MPRDTRPEVLVFDVNETLTDMGPLSARLEDIGLPGHLLPIWFAGVLRDGFAVTLAGGHATFAAVARDGLRSLLARERPGTPDPGSAVDHVLAALPGLPVHPDVPDGVRALHAAGHRLVTLTNGSADTTRSVLDRVGLGDCFEAHLDVEGAGRWKPAPEAYAYALRTVGVPAERAMLVAVHPWDIDGAGRAGLSTAWLRRRPDAYPSALRPADREATGIADLARRLDTASER
ncbi:haloacid dehalogenase type II [Streptomyces gibsoniae]|uniref:Haloacid dehalogenase type II n=1 Tax=Streptomyces gibsoniae TaxID=3075529 RepID=A0ABU2U082_9ACTN|nr:haloacid dehalogenase type II [Streptomyces sp. DSM 41699]MDT0466588.1 haloacid dehalogenase type II [Streptomyces sp. DSM 41699]